MLPGKRKKKIPLGNCFLNKKHVAKRVSNRTSDGINLFNSFNLRYSHDRFRGVCKRKFGRKGHNRGKHCQEYLAEAFQSNKNHLLLPRRANNHCDSVCIREKPFIRVYLHTPVSAQGLTVQVDESGNLIIARILGGSTAARQGLLRTGEVILEVNGKEVHNPEELQDAMQEVKENLTLKLAPGIASDGSHPVKSTVSDW